MPTADCDVHVCGSPSWRYATLTHLNAILYPPKLVEMNIWTFFINSFSTSEHDTSAIELGLSLRPAGRRRTRLAWSISCKEWAKVYSGVAQARQAPIFALKIIASAHASVHPVYLTEGRTHIYRIDFGESFLGHFAFVVWRLNIRQHYFHIFNFSLSLLSLQEEVSKRTHRLR